MIENNTQDLSVDSRWGRSLLAFIAAIGVVILLIMTSAYPPAQIVMLTAALCLLAALVTWQIHEDRQRHRELSVILRNMPIPFVLASVPGFFKEYAKFAESLTMIVRHNDLLFRDLALTRLEAIAVDVAILARGEIVFDATETWRTAYQHVLETLRVKTYFSVAWVRTNDYWNDVPGRQSMQLNYDLICHGFRIERIHILSDELWPFDENLPIVGILEWLVEQRRRGIHVSLVRESDLSKEPKMLCDFAIYGDRATGAQELDEQSHTLRFVLAFGEANIRQGLNRWERLKLFSTSFDNLMDRVQT